MNYYEEVLLRRIATSSLFDPTIDWIRWEDGRATFPKVSAASWVTASNLELLSNSKTAKFCDKKLTFKKITFLNVREVRKQLVVSTSQISE